MKLFRNEWSVGHTGGTIQIGHEEVLAVETKPRVELCHYEKDKRTSANKKKINEKRGR